MAFPESVQQEVRLRARATCECAGDNCQHYGPCKARGTHFHHKKPVSAGGGEEPANCQFLCKQCHEQAHDVGEGLGQI
jgi:5-methylcytosine-specific restriction endonuclease McrA